MIALPWARFASDGVPRGIQMPQTLCQRERDIYGLHDNSASERRHRSGTSARGAKEAPRSP